MSIITKGNLSSLHYSLHHVLQLSHLSTRGLTTSSVARILNTLLYQHMGIYEESILLMPLSGLHPLLCRRHSLRNTLWCHLHRKGGHTISTYMTSLRASIFVPLMSKKCWNPVYSLLPRWRYSFPSRRPISVCQTIMSQFLLNRSRYSCPFMKEANNTFIQ